jgi:AcrR family transcriptional regulator
MIDVVDSRKRLLAAAVRVFAEVGFRGATTRRIAEEAGVNEVTLFRHFGSKSKLISEAMCDLVPLPGGALPDVPGDVRRELTQWCEEGLAGLRANRGVIRRSMAELDEHPDMGPVICEAKTPRFESLCTYVTKVCRPHNATEREDLRTACTMLYGAIFSDAVGRDVSPTLYPSPEDEAASRYVDMFLRCVGHAPSAVGVSADSEPHGS